ncbi:MlaE family ABC transporter permease [Flavihumibacter solisilvae]|jgi:phospholipid/cholesterol/gamma-HCH transport system permease protein|uniref:ABC transporter permease n=1 Tax=Flavihumibacter solisilvae TaxID=1349421 RepID=A0A0C1L2B0_9BACT|nr:ABC transporter permease [Flavihumibacter solisilvae]KIC94132.1 ABC transporter permease [Flavihumibacter solisilvae]
MPDLLPFNVSGAFTRMGDQAYFFRSFVRNLFDRDFEWEEFLRQSYQIGYKSIGICALTGFILGIVLTLQSTPTLKDFGAETFIPGMVAISIIREIGPVITALICAGKTASRIGAELGSMNVTEQIDAMEVSGANPIKFLVVTRILACMIMIPMLTILADAMALLGGYAASALSAEITLQLYFTKAISNLEFSDIIPAVIKTILFGFSIGFVGCYKGFHSTRGTESVGQAANSAVVTASIWIVIIDAIVVQVTGSILYA